MKSKMKKLESQDTGGARDGKKNDLLQKLFEVEEEEKEENTLFLNRFKQLRNMHINGTNDEIKESTGETPKKGKVIGETSSLPNHLSRFADKS